jgi:AraC-like DNA-binding protein
MSMGERTVPWSRVLTFTDPLHYQAAIRAGDWDIYPTKSGQFRGELTQINLNKLWMQRLHQELPQVQIGAVTPNRKVIGFLTEARQPALHHRGEEISSNDIVVNTGMMHQRTEGDCRYGGMSLSDDDFDAACQAITGRDFAVPAFKHIFRPGPDLMRRLLNLHEMVGAIAKTTPELFDLPEAVRALEQQLIHLMVRCLTEGSVSTMTGGGRRHDAIVARFEEFLEANPNTPLYLPEICAAIGAAERTLRDACEKHLGMGPIRYLALRRMHLVRRALARAVSSTTTVTRIATDHGFWELGRFSVNYRAMFGETPSVTLQRPPDDRLMSLNRPSSFADSEFA